MFGVRYENAWLGCTSSVVWERPIKEYRVVHVLGLGAAFADNSISNDLLCSLSPDLDENWIVSRWGVKSRRTSLPLEFLSETGNPDPYFTAESVDITPTDLTVRAARQAIAAAGIQAEDVGLIIGESPTPLHVTPFEGQRVGAGLHIKVPAYDIFSSAGMLPAHLQAVAKWKAERTPDYILCVTVATPTWRVNYRQQKEGALFGDAAGAMILSQKHSGPLTLEKVFSKTCHSGHSWLSIGHFDNISLDEKAFEDLYQKRFTMLMKELSGEIEPAETFLIGAQWSTPLFRALAEDHGFSPENIHTDTLENHGAAFSASQVGGLAAEWDRLREMKRILVLSDNGGSSLGYALFRTNFQKTGKE